MERDGFVRHRALDFWLSTIFFGNWYPLFRIML